MKSTIKRFLLTAVCTLGFVLPNTAPAAVTQLSFQPTPVDLNDLDHHYSYSWRIDGIDLSNVSLTSATLSFKNIANWDSNPNMLFVYLMDTATHGGVNTFQDHPLNEAPIGDITDHFANGAVIPSLITGSTAITKLFQKSFTTKGTDYTFTFNSAQLQTLTQYITNGHDIAFGFDPECHFFNDGITFTMNFTPVPEAATVIPAVCLIVGATLFEARRRRRLVKCRVVA